MVTNWETLAELSYSTKTGPTNMFWMFKEFIGRKNLERPHNIKPYQDAMCKLKIKDSTITLDDWYSLIGKSLFCFYVFLWHVSYTWCAKPIWLCSVKWQNEQKYFKTNLLWTSTWSLQWNKVNLILMRNLMLWNQDQISMKGFHFLYHLSMPWVVSAESNLQSPEWRNV